MRQPKPADSKPFKGGHVPSGNWFWAVTDRGDLVQDKLVKDKYVKPAVLVIVEVNSSTASRYGYDAEQVAEICAEALAAAQESGRLKRPDPLY